MSALGKAHSLKIRLDAGATEESMVEALRCLEAIVAEGDHEAAHDLEDVMHRTSLEACAANVRGCRRMAKTALSTASVRFPRRCA